ncbi:MAG: hypothetical protein KGI46_02670 [Alphaproteobacteria bacterium]|nr:hypothetical protein [Alphaproteobacteria bacterium]
MAERPSAAITYREQAVRLRTLARDSRSATLRFELLEVAAQFERLAELAERNAARAKVQC